MSLADKLREEFTRAEKARLEGIEGRARVCSRRVAGWAAKAYLEQQKQEDIKSSAYENILQIAEQNDMPSEVRDVIYRLTTNLEVENADGEEDWPDELDLIADARKFVFFLFPQLDI